MDRAGTPSAGRERQVHGNDMQIVNPPKRTSKTTSLDEAAALVRDGDVVGLGGVHAQNAPMALVRALIRRGVRDLTLIPSPSVGIAADMLIAAGCVKTMHVCYVGMEFLGFAPAFRAAAERGEIEVYETDEASIVYGLKGGAGRLPFMAMPPLFEATDLPKVNPMIRTTRDPYTDREVTTVPSLRPDVSLVHVQRCDRYGNAMQLGTIPFDPLLAKASDRVIMSTDEILLEGDPAYDPRRMSLFSALVDAVVDAPWGAHPTSSPGVYNYDEGHMREYVERVRAGDVDGYLEEFVTGPAEHDAYLERVGTGSLLDLRLAKG
jgi:glutaconate CoA-transferase subunit A